MTRRKSKILVTSVGSSPGIDIARSLRLDNELFIVGADNSFWGRKTAMNCCNEVIDIPHASKESEDYINFLTKAMNQYDFIFIGLDIEVQTIVDFNLDLTGKSHIPSNYASGIFLDKYKTYKACKEKRHFPKSALPLDRKSVKEAILDMGNSVWIRPATGTSGIGSFHAKSSEEGQSWIDFCNSRSIVDDWMIQEFLPGKNYNWTGLYHNGTIVASAIMERLEYILANVTISGITGQVKRCITVKDEEVDNICNTIVKDVEIFPNGIYSVDLRCDSFGKPKITEVNVRFAGRNWLYTNAGLNLPLLTVYSFLNEGKFNRQSFNLLEGVEMYRQVDSEPLFKFPQVK